jgi:hypothetical protein
MKNKDLYLLIGQSNMAGRAPFTEAEARPIDGVALLNDKDQWEPARNPLNRYSTIRKEADLQQMGPGYTFSLEMRTKHPDREIGLVVNAKGGSSINEWKKGDTFYDEAIRRTKIALQSGWPLKAILWHQGETDANDPDYLTKVTQLITDLRKDFKEANLPFIAGQINPSDNYLFNDLILKLPELLSNTAVVTNEGLTAMDQWHFDHDSALQLGRRYAEKMQRLETLN